MKKLSEQEMAEMVDNCKKATFLIEKQQTWKISLKERVALEFHLTGCEMCNTFLKRSVVINQFVKQLFHRGNSEFTLADGFKEQLQQQIDAKLDPSANEDYLPVSG